MRRLVVVILTGVALAACGSSSHGTSTTTTSASATRPAGKTISVALASNSSGRKGTPAMLDRLRLTPHRGVSAHLSGFSGTTLPQQLESYAQAVSSFWTQALSGSQPPIQLPAATLNIIDQTPVTCGSQQITTTDPFGYCPATQSIELPLQYITAQIEPIGAAAVLLVVSDMYGYHVMNAAGVLGKFSAAQAELADACLSGQFFFYGIAGNSNLHVDPGDEQAVTTLLTKMAPAGGATAPGAVTSQQLIDAFNKGAVPNNGRCLS
jgi:hypothetical protein